MNNRLFTMKVNLIKNKVREEKPLHSVMQSQAEEAPSDSVLFSTSAQRRTSLISEEPFNWTSVGTMGSKSKWTQIGQRVNELSGRWNKNRPSHSGGTLLSPAEAEIRILTEERPLSQRFSSAAAEPKFKVGEFKQCWLSWREETEKDKQSGNFTRKAIRLLWMLSHWKQLLT